jgi:hypothetical protein
MCTEPLPAESPTQQQQLKTLVVPLHPILPNDILFTPCLVSPLFTTACSFWGALGAQLQLTPKQFSTLSAMNELLETGLRPIFSSIGSGARQGLLMAVQQEQRPQPRLLHAQAELLEQQGSALSKIKMLILQVWFMVCG